MTRPEQPEPFLRGAAFGPAPGVPYPRARDDARLPRDTWSQACVPAGVRLELVGDAERVSIQYRTETDDPGFRGPGGGLSFQLWRAGRLLAEGKAVVGDGVAELPMGDDPPEARAIVYLPEAMRPTVVSVQGAGGSIEPPDAQPRWVAYGDSIVEGWSASAPALGWAARVHRDRGLDLLNMGYAGAARAELASAEHMASRNAEIYSISHGTNCWSVTPHSVDTMRANLAAFLDVLRAARPETGVVVASPVLRPDAEDQPNALGASLADLRRAMEDVVQERVAMGDAHLTLVPGRTILDESMLADAVHPDDEGHVAIAAAMGPALMDAL